MKLYTDNQGNWTGTQADAKKAWGKDMALVEVPVSKEALMKWLNKCRVVSQAHAQIAAQTTSAEVVNAEPVSPRNSFSETDQINLKAAYDNAGLAREYLRRVYQTQRRTSDD